MTMKKFDGVVQTKGGQVLTLKVSASNTDRAKVKLKCMYNVEEVIGVVEK